MAYQKIALALLFALACLGIRAGDLDASQLTGSWKITDVKFSGPGAPAAESGNCYLCDLYHHDRSLVFTADGHVQYQDNANPNEVFFKIAGNQLVFYRDEIAEIVTPEKTEPQNKTVTTAVEFKVSLTNNVLTLERIYPNYTETYTLTK